MFLVDQPGIGGNKITESTYLTNFGPGHFNFTFLLGEKGFNELDMLLLKHLLHNKKPVAFVRTQCDSAITGMQDKQEVSYKTYVFEIHFIYCRKTVKTLCHLRMLYQS